MARITLYPSAGENDGVAQYRMLLPGRSLQAQGADVAIDFDGPKCYWDQFWEPSPQRPYAPEWVTLMGLLPQDTDVVVFNRPSQKWIYEAIPFFHQQGIRVVIDVDDRFNRIPIKNVAHDYYEHGRVTNLRWLHKSCQIADLVTVSTPALLEAYGYGHGVILPNLVPEHYLNIVGRREPTTMGWTGTLRTHPEDLQVTAGAVRRVLDAHTDWRFSVVGDGEGVMHALNLRSEPSHTRGWIPFVEYPIKMGRFSLGIVPLRIDKFNESKSCLKAMEFAALGIPVVMSPIPDNVRLHQMGIGRLASNPNRWFKELDRLIRHPQLRQEMSEQGRAIMKGLTYEQHCGRWLEAWTGKRGARK